MVEHHKARLAAELTRARLRRSCASTDDLRSLVNGGRATGQAHACRDRNELSEDGTVHFRKPQPRWVRINTLKTTLEDQLSTTFANHKSAQTLDAIIGENNIPIKPNVIHVDQHVPNLLALTPSTDLSKSQAYLDGSIILQDKASCFPAYLLDPDIHDKCLDACAAPGNKSTHLAAILHENGYESMAMQLPIHASERDQRRASVLSSMLAKAGASDLVRIHRQDFLAFDPTKPPCNTITALLLDPSCSGSGISSRDQAYHVTLPSAKPTTKSDPRSGRKRKRTKLEPLSEASMATSHMETSMPPEESAQALQKRLDSLREFQTRLLLHAFRFPNARKITYSTCSIFADENENVIVHALLRSQMENLGWRILLRSEQVSGMQAWNVRGDVEACQKLLPDANLDAAEIADACIRCEKGTGEGTQGFFVAGLVRDIGTTTADNEAQDEQWEGFDDD